MDLDGKHPSWARQPTSYIVSQSHRGLAVEYPDRIVLLSPNPALQSAKRSYIPRSDWVCLGLDGETETERFFMDSKTRAFSCADLCRNTYQMRVPVRGRHRWSLTGSRANLDGKPSLILRSRVQARLCSSLSPDVESFDVRCGSSGFVTVE